VKRWLPYNEGSSIGDIGSENGTILCDEEYDGGCRITMEKCPRYYAITCGVYGAMVHTAFCGPDDAKEMYEAMKLELGKFMATQTTEKEEYEFYDYFCSKYI